MDDYPSSPLSPPVSTAPTRSSVFSPMRVIVILALALLFVRYLVPSLAEQIQYSLTRGRERAEVESARGELGKVSMQEAGKAFRLVAKSVGPSVVSVRTQSIRPVQARDEWGYALRDPQKQVLLGEGSGVVVDSAGYIVTNNHVVANANAIQVSFSDGRRLAARKVGTDPPTDLAVLKVNATDLIAAPWGDSDKVQVGDPVLAIGNPFQLARTVTFGIISAKDRRGLHPLLDFLQTDAAVNPGNSGGPLVDLNGRIIGINTAIIGKAYQGITFAIPSNVARKTYEDLRSKGKIARGWLGAATTELTPEMAQKLGLNRPEGALVTGVVRNAPAHKAGLRQLDVIVAWNGQPVENPLALSLLVSKTPINSTAKCEIIRGGKQITVEVVVGEMPSQLEAGRLGPEVPE